MFNSIWYKGFRDLTLNKIRSFLVILAIAIGVFGISVVANSYSILMREMDKNYMDTNPSSATLWTDKLSTSDIEKIKGLSYIDDVEKREKVVGRVQVSKNEWKDIWLYVVDDFANIRLDTFTPESGNKIPETGEILFERKALNFTGLTIGQTIQIKIPNMEIATLDLTGSVHSPGLAPSWMEGFAYGFITRDTYLQLGGVEQSSELKIKVRGNTLDKQHIRTVTYQLKDYLTDKGISVTHIEIPVPGKHPHYTQMAALLFLMEVFGILALLLSGVLVSNMITSILEQQTRLIGIMKSIGASIPQIIGLYQGMVIAFSSVALLVAIPAGIYVGRGYALLAAQILNFDIHSYDIPTYIFLIEFASGLLVPLVTSAIPIHRISRITVQEALQDYGIKQEQYSGLATRKTLQPISFFPRPFLLSLRNTFRRRSRLLFTLLVMAVGGTGFIVAMNMFASMYHTVDEKMDAFAYDIQVTFDQPQPTSQINDVLKNISSVKNSEAWGGAYAARVYPDHTTGNSFNIIAPPSDTSLLKTPFMYSGRWLKPEDTNGIVLNQQLLSHEPDIDVGDSITLSINQVDTTWKVLGISKELMGSPVAYVNQEGLSTLLKQNNYSKNAVIVTAKHDSISQTKVAKQLEHVFLQNNMPLSSLQKLADYRIALKNHLVIIATFLIIMSILVVMVGGLGLATTISISTMERTREIGIMRAIGARTYYITGMIVAEGIIIGILSWFISFLLSWPLSRWVSMQFGLIFFEVPLEFAASMQGYIIWFILVILFAGAASFYPSWKASKMSISTALYYE